MNTSGDVITIMIRRFEKLMVEIEKLNTKIDSLEKKIDEYEAGR